MLNKALKGRIKAGGAKNYYFAKDQFYNAIAQTAAIRGKTQRANFEPKELAFVKAQVDFIAAEDIESEYDDADYINLPELIYNRYKGCSEKAGEKQLLIEMFQLMYQLACPNIEGVKNINQETQTYFNTLLNVDVIEAFNPEHEIMTDATPLLSTNGNNFSSYPCFFDDNPQPFANAELKPRKDQEKKCDWDWCCTIV